MLGGIYAARSYASKYKRFLIIDCETHRAFQHKFSEFFTINNLQYSDDYSIIPSHLKFKDHSIDEIKNTNLSRAGKALYGMFGHSVQTKSFEPKENIAIWAGTSGSKGKWFWPELKVNQTILQKLNQETKITEPYISVHFRNTDIGNKASRFTEKLKKITTKNNIKTIYLATDDSKALNTFKAALPNIKIIQLSSAKPNVKNQHYSCANKQECYNQIYDTLRDLYFIFHSKYFLPSPNSGLSRFIIMQIANKGNLFNIQSSTVVI